MVNPVAVVTLLLGVPVKRASFPDVNTPLTQFEVDVSQTPFVAPVHVSLAAGAIRSARASNPAVEKNFAIPAERPGFFRIRAIETFKGREVFITNCR
jgi:hypothetical protein